jgi:hypothetical protein
VALLQQLLLLLLHASLLLLLAPNHLAPAEQSGTVQPAGHVYHCLMQISGFVVLLLLIAGEQRGSCCSACALHIQLTQLSDEGGTPSNSCSVVAPQCPLLTCKVPVMLQYGTSHQVK